MPKRISLRMAAITALAGLALLSGACSKKVAAKRMAIAVMPKGTTHEFWKTVHAGAISAGRELGVEIIWKGPQKEDDREQQVMLVEDMISRGVDGIVLAPLDDRALMGPVREAKNAGIPAVIIDSGLQGSEYISYVATDNRQGGVIGGRRLAEVMGGRGNVLLVRYQVGSDSTTEREAGFLETAAREFPGLKILAADQYGGPTVETTYRLVENLLSRFPETEGVFCPNESTTFGALRALAEAGLAGKVKLVGFDASSKMVEGLKNGQIHGLVLQHPFRMGYLGVKTMVEHLQGKAVAKRIDTGVRLVTAGNMDQPEIRQLLLPDLKPYLDE